MADNPASAVPAVEHNYARFNDTIQLLMDDGATFTIDRTAISFMSQELHSIMEALGPVQVWPMPGDNTVSWRITFEVFYDHEQNYGVATQDQLMQAMLLCDKYNIVTVRDRLACILLHRFEDCDALQLAETFRDSHSPVKRAYDRLLDWETKSYVAPAQVFKLSVSSNLSHYLVETESRNQQIAKSELARLVDIMLEQEVASCENIAVHGSMGVSMAHTMWKRAISDVRNARKDYNPPHWSNLVSDGRTKYLAEQGCRRCKGKLNDAFNRVSGRARREIDVKY